MRTALHPAGVAAIAAMAVFCVMTTLWFVGRVRRNYSFVDLGWAANFLWLAPFLALAAPGWGVRRAVIAAMYVAWSLRLTIHLARRILGQPEEGRYARLRRDWAGASLHAKFLAFFLVQGALDLVLLLPLWFAVRNGHAGLAPIELAGVAVWALSLAGESTADRQLARFKRDPRNAGRVCNCGLWGLSRHPNYFFECGIWVGYALFALGSPWGTLALVVPAIMIYLLLEVTGVRPTEEQALESRGELYRDYQRRVSRFVPWPRGGLAGSQIAMRLLDTGLVPDALIRSAIRRLLARRLAEESRGTLEVRQERRRALLAELRGSPLAIHTQTANAQHYEVPAEFFSHVLGPRLKYSSAYFAPGVVDLGAAEVAMLDLTMKRAGLSDGEDVLELGCGWGSLTLTMAERFPRSRITAVSNSHSQRNFILARAAERGLANVDVVTCDVNVLQFPDTKRFDRIVSVEMFEHLRNYGQLFSRIAGWLRPRGSLFVHIFTHRVHAYPFETRDSSDFMARHFFTGGIMPSDDLLLHFQDALTLRDHWHVDGTHYQKTSEAWLANMDRARDAVWPILEKIYGAAHARRWWTYWRVFFMACAELWGYSGGREWLVSHYRFERNGSPA